MTEAVKNDGPRHGYLQYKEIVKRYCPILGENVVMVRTFEEGRDEYVCITCDYCGCGYQDICRVKPMKG